jgi:hypothetical protein
MTAVFQILDVRILPGHSALSGVMSTHFGRWHCLCLEVTNEEEEISTQLGPLNKASSYFWA